MTQEYFTVELASAINLGIPLADMGSVIQLETANICTVPGVASFWYGVVNFKGSLLWVLDSDRFLMQSLMAETPKTTPHRFFDLEISRKSSPKLTAVIIQNQQQSGSKNRVALVAQQLKGIISVESACLRSLTDNVSAQLRECCSTIAQIEEQEIYIIDSAASLQRLHQQSSLVSV